MYCQITTKCNMTCEHCCFACTAKGEDMTLATFRNAIKFSTEYDDIISLGGGEPTIHPRFWEILGLAMGNFESVWLATNGKKTEIALALAKMASKGAVACRLSLDDYHDPIDPRVEAAFDKGNHRHDSREVFDARDISHGAESIGGQLVNAGRCDWGMDDCACPEIFIKPNGDIRICGCDDSPVVGNVNAGGYSDD